MARVRSKLDLADVLSLQIDVDDIKGKAVLWIAVLILVAYVVST